LDSQAAIIVNSETLHAVSEQLLGYLRSLLGPSGSCATGSLALIHCLGRLAGSAGDRKYSAEKLWEMCVNNPNAKELFILAFENERKFKN
jgi:hypothetical protein